MGHDFFIATRLIYRISLLPSLSFSLSLSLSLSLSPLILSPISFSIIQRSDINHIHSWPGVFLSYHPIIESNSFIILPPAFLKEEKRQTAVLLLLIQKKKKKERKENQTEKNKKTNKKKQNKKKLNMWMNHNQDETLNSFIWLDR